MVFMYVIIHCLRDLLFDKTFPSNAAAADTQFLKRISFDHQIYGAKNLQKYICLVGY